MSHSTLSLKEDLRRVARQLGHYPSANEYQIQGKYGVTTVIRRFGSWVEAIKACGFNYRPAQHRA